MGSFEFVVPKCACLVGVQRPATCGEIKTVRCTEAGVETLKYKRIKLSCFGV